MPRLSTNLFWMNEWKLCLSLRLQVWDKPILSSSNPGVASKTGGVMLLFLRRVVSHTMGSKKDVEAHKDMPDVDVI